MPKHELYCNSCGEEMKFECKTADEAKCLLDNEYVHAIRYARQKEHFLLQAASITHQTLDHYNNCKTHGYDKFTTDDILAIYTCLLTITDGVCRAGMRKYADSPVGSVPYFIYNTNLRLFDMMMTERGFNDLAQDEEQQGAAKAAAYTREDKRGDYSPQRGH